MDSVRWLGFRGIMRIYDLIDQLNKCENSECKVSLSISDHNIKFYDIDFVSPSGDVTPCLINVTQPISHKQVSLSRTRQVERNPNDSSYLLTFLDGSTKILEGDIDSIYHDGPHCTTFTITFNI